MKEHGFRAELSATDGLVRVYCPPEIPVSEGFFVVAIPMEPMDFRVALYFMNQNFDALLDLFPEQKERLEALLLEHLERELTEGL